MYVNLPSDDSVETQRVLRAIADGDQDGLAELLERYREWLHTFVRMRVDGRIASRVDASDIVQETLADVHQRLPDFLRRRPLSFRAWLIRTAMDHLSKARRSHLAAACRSVSRERRLDDESAERLADRLFDARRTPLQEVLRIEVIEKVRACFRSMPEHDREILLLRHVEGLKHEEAAVVLGISPESARKRHGRALLRLNAELAGAGLSLSDG